MRVNFELNAEKLNIECDPLMSLLEWLRTHKQLVASKEGCGEGECGACSVLFNGQLVNSCLLPMIQVEGQQIVTWEGLRDTSEGECLIHAFRQAGAVQCGFCTPGMVLALYCVLRDVADPDEQTIRRAISGNLCRCTGYGMIVDAARIAVQQGGDLWRQ